ncbi:hypothetical protein HKX48_004631 [Thoreauomyces humboldtii]|nr:hypothetical protein HKX48_004631 [Thoreauomyces humboldtii]
MSLSRSAFLHVRAVRSHVILSPNRRVHTSHRDSSPHTSPSQTQSPPRIARPDMRPHLAALGKTTAGARVLAAIANDPAIAHATAKLGRALKDGGYLDHAEPPTAADERHENVRRGFEHVAGLLERDGAVEEGQDVDPNGILTAPEALRKHAEAARSKTER